MSFDPARSISSLEEILDEYQSRISSSYAWVQCSVVECGLAKKDLIPAESGWNP